MRFLVGGRLFKIDHFGRPMMPMTGEAVLTEGPVGCASSANAIDKATAQASAYSRVGGVGRD